MGLAEIIENFEFWQTLMRGTPRFCAPKFCHIPLCYHVNASYQFYLYSVSVKKVQILMDSFGKNPLIEAPPNFVIFYLFVIFPNPENFMRLA